MYRLPLVLSTYATDIYENANTLPLESCPKTALKGVFKRRTVPPNFSEAWLTSLHACKDVAVHFLCFDLFQPPGSLLDLNYVFPQFGLVGNILYPIYPIATPSICSCIKPYYLLYGTFPLAFVPQGIATWIVEWICLLSHFVLTSPQQGYHCTLQCPTTEKISPFVCISLASPLGCNYWVTHCILVNYTHILVLVNLTS